MKKKALTPPSPTYLPRFVELTLESIDMNKLEVIQQVSQHTNVLLT